jgi:phytoene/squalene synthetase
VLRIWGHRDAKLDAWSDDICTALQLTNFWQDLKADYDRGRVYLPREEQRVHGAREEDLDSGRITPPWQDALSAAALRTRALFDAGRPLCDAMRGRLRHELRATWLGGTRILDRLARANFDVTNRRPVLGVLDAPWFAWKLLAWTSPRTPLVYRPRSPGRRSLGGGGS